MLQMKVFVGLFFVLCLQTLISAKTADVRYCNTKADYPVKVSGLDIDPYPISSGKKTKFQITASTNEAISGGKLKIDVSYLGFHVYSEDHDLCKETSCPVSIGDFNVTHAEKLPWYTPWGSYTLEMTMVNENGDQLTCITFGFSISLAAEDNLIDDV